MSSNGWVGIDLDGTVARYDGWVDEFHIGEPIPKMVEFVQALIASGREVRIFTARVYTDADDRAMCRDVEAIRETIEDWTEEHIGKRLKVTNVKDYKMIGLYDDRAFHVLCNQGIIVEDERQRRLF